MTYSNNAEFSFFILSQLAPDHKRKTMKQLLPFVDASSKQPLTTNCYCVVAGHWFEMWRPAGQHSIRARESALCGWVRPRDNMPICGDVNCPDCIYGQAEIIKEYLDYLLTVLKTPK